MSHKDDEEVYRNGRFVAYAVMDMNAEDPRKFSEPLGTMKFMAHRNWSLGDGEPIKENQLYTYKWNEAEEYEEEIKISFAEYVKTELKAFVYISLEILSYSNSDVHIRECDDEDADGVIYVTKEKLIEEYGNDSPESMQKALDYMTSEIETYNSYLEGFVYGFVVDDTLTKEESVDVCWEYYGMDHKESGLYESAKESVDYLVKKENERWEATTKMPAWRFVSEIVTNPF